MSKFIQCINFCLKFCTLSKLCYNLNGEIMKVKNLNASSKKTIETIKKTFVELLHEKKELKHVSVTELVKRAGITRSSFYTNYDSIYDVAQEFQDNTIKLLIKDEFKIENMEDIDNYIDVIIDNLKENETTYKMLLSSNEPLIFFDKIRKKFITNTYEIMKHKRNDKYLKLDISFYVDGLVSQILTYFRANDGYTLEEIGENMKKWIKKLFY